MDDIRAGIDSYQLKRNLHTAAIYYHLNEMGSVCVRGGAFDRTEAFILMSLIWGP